MPDDFFLEGDNAYPLSDKLLNPFSGATKQRTHCRIYNFYLSELRICIEMAFRWMPSKWRIFRQNLDYSMEKNLLILMVAAKLHNNVIDKDNLQIQAAEDYELFGVEPLINGSDNNHGYLPTLPSRDAQLDRRVKG